MSRRLTFTGPLWQWLRVGLVRPRPGDRYVASFPRSGNTWLRTVLTNVLDPTAQSDPDVFNALIPGISFRNLPRIYRLPSPRLLKTHAPWWPGARRAVYLVRNGEDALASYYHYLTTRAGQDLPFDVFFERYLAGAYGPPWHTHVESWLVDGRAAMGEGLRVVRFEDLKRDTLAEVTAILDFLAIEASATRVRGAIEEASVENMRAIERRRRGAVATPDASFYRGGHTGQGADLFRPELRERFRRVSARALALAGN